MEHPTVHRGGVRIDNVTTAHALERVMFFLNSSSQHYIVTPNPEFIVAAQHDEEFRTILNQADMAVPDGFGLFLAAPFLKERICGVDLMEKICQAAAQTGDKVFLLGAKKGIAEKAARALERKYAGLTIESHENEEQCAAALRNAQPKILFVALGHPKQEKWIYKNLKNFPSVKVAMGVGGAFDFLSGKVQRAPLLMRNIGLEWLWRLFMEPRRIKRIFTAVIVFPWLLLSSKFKIHNS